MESDNSREQQQSTPGLSWWWDSHSRFTQSQWLHSTLSELDDKTKTMLDLIEDNGDTYAKRAEMYYQKRPQLIKMVQDLHGSYWALADKCDQLKSLKSSNNESASSSFRRARTLQDCERGKLHPSNPIPVEPPNFNTESIEGHSAGASRVSNTSSFELRSLENYLITSIDSRSHLTCSKKISDLTRRENGLKMMRENAWMNERMKFLRLLEENLCKQAELIRRNDEKREMINKLKNENRILNRKASNRSYPSSDKSTIKGNHSWRRKLRSSFCLA